MKLSNRWEEVEAHSAAIAAPLAATALAVNVINVPLVFIAQIHILLVIISVRQATTVLQDPAL